MPGESGPVPRYRTNPGASGHKPRHPQALGSMTPHEQGARDSAHVGVCAGVVSLTRAERRRLTQVVLLHVKQRHVAPKQTASVVRFEAT